MKTLLIYPPWRQPFMPPLSLAALTGYLEAQGTACRQRDLNLETFEHLIEPAWLERARRELVRRIDEIEQDDQLDGETALIHETLVGATLRLPALARKAQEAQHILRHPDRFYRLNRYRRAMRDFEEALSVVALAWAPCRFLLHGHRAAAGDQAPDGTTRERAAGNEKRLLATLIEEAFIPSIAAEKPGLLLVLADYRSQFLPAVTLLRQVRRRLPEVRTAMAGWVAEELLNSSPVEDDLVGVIDVLISGRPEEPLLRLSRALEAGSLDHLPGLVRRGPGAPPKIVAAGALPPEKLPAPSFSGLALDRYFSPEPVLPVRASSQAAEQIIALGRRHHCRRFLITGGLDAKIGDELAHTLAAQPGDRTWFGSLDRKNLPTEGHCRRLAAVGCVKLQLRIGPEGPGAQTDMLDQARRAVRFCPPAGIGIHLHCRLDEDTGGKAVTEPLSAFFTRNGPRLSTPGISFSCRVIRDGRLGPATGGSAPDLYNDATAPVPGTVPGFGRDPGDQELPPESLGEEQRWRLVREAGTVMGPCRTPGTAVHDFLYLARYDGNPPAPPAEKTSPAALLEPAMVLRPSPGLVRGRFRAYDPAVPVNSKVASGPIRFAAAGRRWRATPGDGYICRPLPDLAHRILGRCDGVRTWEQAVQAAAAPDQPDSDLAQRLVRMMVGEGLLVEA